MSITSGNGVPSRIIRAGLTGVLIILRSVGWREGASIRVRWGVHHQTDEATIGFPGRLLAVFLLPALSQQFHAFIVIRRGIAEIWMVLYLLVWA
jgi:hypothetical protein